jgi:hypothetical protein
MAMTKEEIREYQRLARIRRRSDPAYVERQLEKQRQRYRENPERFRAYSKAYEQRHLERYQRRWQAKYLKRYGITIEQFNAMEAAQNGVCAICQRKDNSKRKGKTRRLCVDHCHKTGVVRGLLCSSCNTAIGHLGDSASRVHRAVEYLHNAIGADL